MARKFKHEPEVQKVIDSLSRLYSKAKTLSGLADLLSGEDEELRNNVFHPNRLKGLLDGNEARAINEKTFLTIEMRLQALDINEIQDTEFIDLVNSSSSKLLSRGTPKSSVTQELAIELSAPLGVIQALCSDASDSTSDTIHKTKPDWSWQKGAVENTIQSIKDNQQKNVGLIVPTGGGKTTIASKVIYKLLKNNAHKKCLWVAHRQFLISQARHAFSRVLLEENLTHQEKRTYLDRVTYSMKDNASANATEYAKTHDLLIIDEAHRAGAMTYQPLLNSNGFTGLFLTATPNRNDGRPIGIDQIAYQITPKKLFEAGCIIEPDLEVYEPWDGYSLFQNDETISKFADDVISNLSERFNKNLICCNQTSEVEQIYNALIFARSKTPFSHLFDDDIAFIHGAGGSAGTDRDKCFDDFEARDSGILVATSSLVSEGLDLPSIDSVYVTYQSNSISHLLQTAGRALRHAEGKKKASIIQVRSNDLKYFFNSSWLYQDISDRLRPRIKNIDYSNKEELTRKFQDFIAPLNIKQERKEELYKQVDDLKVGLGARLLLIGTYYHGKAKDFDTNASWRPLWIEEIDDPTFVGCFNDISYSPKIENQKSYSDLLASRFHKFKDRGLANDFVYATNGAKNEILNRNWDTQHRGSSPEIGTTWITNVSIIFQSSRTLLQEFLVDCSNGTEILKEFERSPKPFAIKFKNPISLHHGLLLDNDQFNWVISYLQGLEEQLQTDDSCHWITVAAYNSSQNKCLIPIWALSQLHQLLDPEQREALTLNINQQEI
jgi:superfamily II DNA or RNA helicase